MIKFHTAILTIILAVVFTRAHKVEVKNRLQMREDDHDYDDVRMPMDLEQEMVGPQEEKVEGLHILDANGEVVVEEPTQRILEALTGDHEHGSSITLEEVKAMYDKLQNERRNKLSQDRLKKMLSREQENIHQQEVEVPDDSFINRLLSLVW